MDRNPEYPEETIDGKIKKDILIAEVSFWAQRIGVKDRIREIHLRQMRRKWASVSSRGRLTLNLDLLTQPAAFRRKVIVHELVHLKLNNGVHGKLFRSLVKAYFHEGIDIDNKA